MAPILKKKNIYIYEREKEKKIIKQQKFYRVNNNDISSTITILKTLYKMTVVEIKKKSL